MTNTSQIITKHEIVQFLRKSKNVKGIRLPRDIDFQIEDKVLKVFAHKPTQNMQTDGAAFEGWIIALKGCLPEYFHTVELDFLVPDHLQVRYGIPEVGHYNRFLYRLNNLLRLFPEWFTVSSEKQGIVDDFYRWLESSTTLLNHSLRERISVIHTEHMERKIESWLVYEEGKDLICDLWHIDENKLFNQLPIGVFYESIIAKNAIFTRGASAIDLWGIGKDGTTLHMIELKCGDNKGMGVISETLFYAGILYDACIREDNTFQFGTYKSTLETSDKLALMNNGERFKRLAVHILAEKYHALFSEDVVNVIQNGFSKLAIDFDRASYSYEKRILIP